MSQCRVQGLGMPNSFEAGINTYRYQFELYLKYPILNVYKESTTIMAISFQGPCISQKMRAIEDSPSDLWDAKAQLLDLQPKTLNPAQQQKGSS